MHTDWIWGLLGGGLIGLGAAVYLLGNGQIMGASGIIGGLVDGSGRRTALDRLLFLAALISAPALLLVLSGTAATPEALTKAATHVTSNPLILCAAGLLVGFGTRLANGCTSGHGVCGISRLSPRGLVATIVFIASGAATVVLFRHVMGMI